MKREQRLNHLNAQIKRLSKRIKTIEAKTDRIADFRLLLVIVGGISLFILIFLPFPILFWSVLIGTIVGFVMLVNAHRQVEYSLKKHRTWKKIKQEHRARMLLDWKHIPDVNLPDKHHPLETDLDLRDLHQLLNTAASQSGVMRLRKWLLNPEPYQQTIEQRQKLVLELKDRPTFRDKLSLLSRLSSSQIRGNIQTKWIREWLQSDIPKQQLDVWIAILGILAVANVIAFVLLQMNIVSGVIVGSLWGLYALLYISRAGLLMRINQDSLQLYEVLSRIKAIMGHLESYPYQDMPNMRKLCMLLLEAKPSQHIRRLMGTLAASNLRGNPILWMLLNALMPWDMFFLRRLHSQKLQLVNYMPEWFDVWHEIEALNSLATFAYLNPDATMPTLDDKHVFSATNIGHPLIATESRVSNGFDVTAIGDVAILTGSNMSGKSSFLRTLGVNLVMAYAGGVVVADSLQTGIFRLFSCIRVTDSLDDGISYFYAEVRRLRALLDALQTDHELPLFFVIDEIFRGTNNRERLIGSRSYINALVGENGIGLIATHDLELTQLADGNPQVRNLHFREHVEEGRMVFDYVLRDGASPTTNALQIMAMEGLPVEEDVLHSEARD